MRRVDLLFGFGIVALAVACGGTTEQTPVPVGSSGAGTDSGVGGSAGKTGQGGFGGGSAGTTSFGGSGGAAGTTVVGGAGGAAGTIPPNGGSAGVGGTPGTCPSTLPWGDLTCTVEGEVCHYPACGTLTAPCKCTNGKWLCELIGCVDSGPPSPCPSTLPSGSCTDESLECWYGDDPRPQCRARAWCDSGKWSAMTPKCEGPSSQCPADPKNPPEGVCGNGKANFCIYGEGYGCQCEAIDAPPMPDGGNPGLTWTCLQPPGGGCPNLAPNPGQPCGLPASKQCVYGSACQGFLLGCSKGFWALLAESQCDTHPY